MNDVIQVLSGLILIVFVAACFMWGHYAWIA